MTDEMNALEKAQTDYALLTDDYEELAHDVMRLRAERDALAASLAKYQECRVHDVDEKNWLRDRVSVLEVALQRYGMHENDCPMYRRGPVAKVSCTCGFEAVCGFALDREAEHG